MAKVIKVGIIGCGAIGSRLAEEIDKNSNIKLKLAALCDIDADKSKRLSLKLKGRPEILEQQKLISSVDFVIESASAKCAAKILEAAINNKKDILVMSVGGLLGRDDLFNRARISGVKVFIPSGAISGIDSIKAAKIVGIKRLTLTTYKGPRSLSGVKYLVDKGLDVSKIKEETEIFSGPVAEAVKNFPQNINVAAVLSLASGMKDLTVKIVLSPQAKTNIHKIEAEGDFGKITTIAESVPCPDNPKTSFIAVLSAIAVLKQISDNIKIGN